MRSLAFFFALLIAAAAPATASAQIAFESSRIERAGLLDDAANILGDFEETEGPPCSF